MRDPIEWPIDFLLSFVLTWAIGLTPPLLIRYLAKRPLETTASIIICVVFWLINLVIFAALGSQSKTHVVLILIAYVSYRILTRPVKGDVGAMKFKKMYK